MKKLLISFIALFLFVAVFSNSLLGQVPSNSPHMGEYLSIRFVTINYNGNVFSIDMKNVESVVYDSNGHFSNSQYTKSANDSPDYGVALAGFYWIKFKNGTKLHTGTSSAPQTKWNNYVTFITNHPEFLYVP